MIDVSADYSDGWLTLKSGHPASYLGATINNLAPGGMGTGNKHEVDLYKLTAGWISYL